MLSTISPALLCRRRVRASSAGGDEGGGGGGDELYPNRPSGWTNSTEIDFSQTPPTGTPVDSDRAISGAPGWFMIFFQNPTDWTHTTDAVAPNSPPDIWRGHWAPGVYGGGVIGEGGGHGIGNVFTRTPGGTN
jgi:hypothetical protein